jgi:type IV pilus assembly protein PilC
MAKKEDLYFVWQAKDKSGSKVDGELKCENISKAKQILRGQGLTSIKIKKKSKPLWKKKVKVSVQDIANFTRQLSTMLNSGVPLIQAFDIVADGTDNTTMKKLITGITKDVQTGSSLSEALSQEPEYFDELYCNLISAGEKSGALEVMLEKIAVYLEKSETLKKKIKKALSYPITILTVSAIVTITLLIKVVPTFAEMFEGFGSELPAFTQVVLNMSYFTQDCWYLMAAGAIGIKFAFKHYSKKRKFIYFKDTKILKMPILGGIVEKSAIARFARTLSTTFAAGVPLLEGIEAAAGASGNAFYKEKIFEVRNEVEMGQQLNFAMKNSGVFPNMIVQMVAIGEESGALDSMLDKAASNYEEDVDTLVDSMTSMIEPLVMAFLGVIVGGLLIAMYLPIFAMGGAM